MKIILAIILTITVSAILGYIALYLQSAYQTGILQTINNIVR